jgi:hypothetical protein
MLEDRNLPSTFTVDHLADDLVGSGLNGSLRYTITNAVDNDTITFGVTGTINLTGALPDLTHSVSIQGPGADRLTVRRDTGGNYRILTVDSGTMVSISGLMIANGYVPTGGGIRNSGTLTVSNCIISGNTAYGGLGGGIYNDGTMTISSSTISGNFALNGTGFGTAGGGIFNSIFLPRIGALTVNNSTVSGNSIITDGYDVFGSGIYGATMVTNCTISGNTTHSTSSIGAGAIADVGVISNSTISGNNDMGIVNEYVLTLSNSTVSGNNGTGIFTFGDRMTVSNSTVSGNVSTGVAAGIFCAQGTNTLNNCTVSGNSNNGTGGGGIEVGGSLTVNNSTISDNHSSFQGGGIYVAGLFYARNTIIAGNTAPTGADLRGPLRSQGHNLIGNTRDSGSLFDATDLLNVNPLLGPLQNNGGPTQTMALLAGSPALNAGDSTQLGVADQRGVVRSGGVNIGAYQASASAFALTGLPASAVAGTPLTVTVTAQDRFGQTALGYTGTVHFSSSDGQAVLPTDYAFTSADAGTHAFTNGVALKTAGNQSVTATDTTTSSLIGNASVLVNPAAADHLLFLQQPTDTAAGQTITPALTVAVVDQFGNVVTSDNADTVTLAIGTNPRCGTLSGTLTVTVSGGIATFNDLSIDQAGDGYTLHATTAGLTGANSDPFSITA